MRQLDTIEITGGDDGRLFLQFADELGVQTTQRQWAMWKRREGRLIEAAIREAGHNRKLRARLRAVGIKVKG